MAVTLITPTGGRGEAFSLCEQWIRNQTYKGDIQWLVTDDCEHLKKTLFTAGQVQVKAPKEWSPDINTHRYNMDALLEKVSGDYVFIIEDDEYYAPNYIESMLKLLETSVVAGISNDRYYHIKAKGYKVIGNWKHASLCRTALRSTAWKILYQAVHSGEYYFDIDFWRRCREKEISMNLIANSSLSVGIKGMPGRAGLGAGHAIVGYARDKDLTTLKDWLGNDFKYYQPFVK